MVARPKARRLGQSRGDGAVHKYLARWGAPEHALKLDEDATWDRAVVLPCRDESPSKVEAIRKHLASLEGTTLLIVVVNGPPDDSPTARDRAMASLVDSPVRQGAITFGWIRGAGADALWMERCGDDGIPPSEGVGRARKIGGDVALALWSAGRVRSPWIHWSDADARVSPDIAQADMLTSGRNDVTAIVWPFLHHAHPDQAIDLGHLKHECWMRWWVRGLERAGSPFAYHTIGSSLSVAARAYAQVRGVPTRPAGEDFHLLNKLAKLGAVLRPRTVSPVEIEARTSARVPFGTGPAVARLAVDPGGWRLSRDVVFEHLAVWLRVMDRWVAGAENPWEGSDGHRPRIEAALDQVGGPAWSSRLEGATTARQGRLLAHQWFDGLRTLRFVHALERTPGFEPVIAPAMLALSNADSVTEVRAACQRLREDERAYTPEVGRTRMFQEVALTPLCGA